MAETVGSVDDMRIITLLNPYTESLLREANELKNSDEFEKAITIYDQVLVIDPRNARAFHSKGNALDLLGRYQEAIACYESALSNDPFNAETWYNKGITLKKLGCENEGSECIQQGISIAAGSR